MFSLRNFLSGKTKLQIYVGFLVGLNQLTAAVFPEIKPVHPAKISATVLLM